MKLCLGSDDDVLEPRTVSDQVGILEAEAGLSHRCQSVGPSHEDGMGWDGMQQLGASVDRALFPLKANSLAATGLNFGLVSTDVSGSCSRVFRG